MKPESSTMSVGEKRGLTAGEADLACKMFADGVDWDRVRIVQAPSALGFGAMVPIGKTIVFAKWRAWQDFTRAPIGEQGWFVHELAHVWQAKCGVLLVLAKLGALGKAAYAYEPREGARFKDYNIEGQAEIARHLFLARAEKPAPSAPTLQWLETIWAGR